MKLALALLAATALCTRGAHALTMSTPDRPGECRVRSVRYTTDLIQLVVPAHGATTVVLSPDEQAGDLMLASNKWKGVSTGNTFTLAAAADAPPTNINLATPLPDGSYRSYTFLATVAPGGIILPGTTHPPGPIAQNALVGPGGRAVATDAAPAPPTPLDCNRPDIPYAMVRIVYPPSMLRGGRGLHHAVSGDGAESAAGSVDNPMPPRRPNAPLYGSTQPKRCDMKWLGSADLLPLSACNVGTQTTFFWPGQQPTPGIFVIQSDGTEQSINSAPDPTLPGWVVVSTTSRFWALRLGDKEVAYLYDAAYNPYAVPPPEAPLPLASHVRCYHSHRYSGQHCVREADVTANALAPQPATYAAARAQ